jgi:hypothetical protein
MNTCSLCDKTALYLAAGKYFCGDHRNEANAASRKEAKNRSAYTAIDKLPFKVRVP